MMDEKGFNGLVDEIMGQGYAEERAVELAVMIGDLPIVGEDGMVEVRDDDGVVERLGPLRFFGMKGGNR